MTPPPAARLPTDPTARFALLVAAWALTRFVVLVVTRARQGVYPSQDDAFEMTLFEQWGPAFVRGEGAVPLQDGPWEYPAAAAVLIAAPSLLRGAPYVLGFVAQMTLYDLAVLLLLAGWGLRRGTLGGAWFWVVAVPLLGPVALGRFDVVPVLLAAGGLIAASASAPLAAGVLLATGAVVKLWPALLVPLVLALHRGGVRVLAGGVAVGAVVLGLLARYGAVDQSLSFLRYQQERGLEVESVPALPLVLARSRGEAGIRVFFDFGSYQVDGPGAEVLRRVSDVGLPAVLGLVAVLTWRARRPQAEHEPAHEPVDHGQVVVVLSLVLMTGFLLFDKVLSAQYPLWLAGLLAVALCWPGSPVRPVVLPLCGVLVLTQAVYPMTFQDLLAGAQRPVAFLVARDLLLVVVFVQVTWAAWRLGRRPAAGAPAGPAAGAPADTTPGAAAGTTATGTAGGDDRRGRLGR